MEAVRYDVRHKEWNFLWDCVLRSTHPSPFIALHDILCRKGSAWLFDYSVTQDITREVVNDD